MKKFLMAVTCAVFLCVASAAMATTIYYESTNLAGTATLTYGIGPTITAPQSSPSTQKPGALMKTLLTLHLGSIQ